MIHPTDDTIAAISSADGPGDRGLVRLSGPAAIELADRVFVGDRPLAAEGGFATVPGRVRVGEPALEAPARAYVFRRPRSYTRQDVVELHVPGSGPVLAELLSALIAGGARSAEPGEFTLRALLSGRIDLSQAEAVADVIHAGDQAHLRAATEAMGGRLHRLCSQASDQLAEQLAVVEASIDLADEGIEPGRPAEVADLLRAVARRLTESADGALEMPDHPRPPTAVLVGRVNVGKSSLLNALTGTDRAIVSDLAGTTRDVLRAPLELATGTVELIDAAGFHAPQADVAPAARSAAERAIASADLLVLVLSAQATTLEAETRLLAQLRRLSSAPVLVAVNKCDLADPPADAPAAIGLHPGPAIHLSARTGQGLDQLTHRLAEQLGLAGSAGGERLGLHRRQRRALHAAGQAAAQAAGQLADTDQLADTAELVALDLRDALAQLGQITGQVTTEDVLGRIFRRFCAGK
jgi:tRNA modification GTPase